MTARKKEIEKKNEHIFDYQHLINVEREHAEFYNAYTIKSVKRDVQFINAVYGETVIEESRVDGNFIQDLKQLGKHTYFFIESLTSDTTPQLYIKRKNEFITRHFPDKRLFFLTWNGLINNDSFRRLLRHRFGLQQFFERVCPQHIPPIGTQLTRYRTKFVLAVDMANNSDGTQRIQGRVLDDGSGLLMKEKIVWLPNGKSIPVFPSAYIPMNQTQVILIRHGKSTHDSGGDNPEFVGSGYWDNWENNRRISGSVSNTLHENGIKTACDLGKDFRIVVDTMDKEGCQLWAYSKDKPIHVFGSESENTEQTSRHFLKSAGYTNLNFQAIWGLNSQKYGALTHKFKKDVISQMVEIYGDLWGDDEKARKDYAKKMLKNRFYHYPEGETLIEADWRIAHSFIDLLRSNLGRRIMLCDHSGAIRVFEALIRTLDFADYASIKEKQDSIIGIIYQPGLNVRYDYIQKSDFKLR